MNTDVLGERGGEGRGGEGRKGFRSWCHIILTLLRAGKPIYCAAGRVLCALCSAALLELELELEQERGGGPPLL